MTAADPDRRAVLAGLTGVLVSAVGGNLALLAGAAHNRAIAAPARPDNSPCLAILDWALLETVVALDVPVLLAAELRQYRRLPIGHDLPADTLDMGLRGAPNLELLQAQSPDLILISSFYEAMRPQLERIAPVLSLATYTPDRPALDLARDAVTRLGALLDRETQAQDLLSALDHALDAGRQKLSDRSERPAIAVNLGDARHLRVFGPESLVGGVLAGLGRPGAWEGPTSYSASAPVPVTALARMPEADVIVVGPTPEDLRAALARNPVWEALPQVREGRIVWTGDHNHYGGVPTALRLAAEITDGLEGLGHD